MGIKTDRNPGIFAQFAAHITADPTAEILPPCSEWELLRYRREDTDEHGRGYGTHSYGIVYINKRGQQHYTGAAEEDYQHWRDDLS
jgi:hypothetical protein